MILLSGSKVVAFSQTGSLHAECRIGLGLAVSACLLDLSTSSRKPIMRSRWIIGLSVAFSSIVSTAVNLAFERRHLSLTPPVIQTSRLEIVDKDGNVRATLGLRKHDSGNLQPQLSLRDADGRESIVLEVDGRGDGYLAFANDYWQEGAIILGHLVNVDDNTQSRTKTTEDKSGAWGLRVRSSQNRFTSMGFFNSGKVMIPIAADSSSK